MDIVIYYRAVFHLRDRDLVTPTLSATVAVAEEWGGVKQQFYDDVAAAIDRGDRHMSIETDDGGTFFMPGPLLPYTPFKLEVVPALDGEV